MVPSAARNGQLIEDLYNSINGDEDARVCKDIPEAACNDQPHNFFAYLGANILGQVGIVLMLLLFSLARGRCSVSAKLRLVVDDAPFCRYVLARALFLSVALAPPF